jgi:hypothetical protein
MKSKAILVLIAIVLVGCAGPNWQHTRITDKTTAARQLVIDDGYCTQVSVGAVSVPMVPPPAVSTISNVNLQGATFNPQTGTTNHSSYTGQVTSVPAGGFGGGFASGMANGLNMGAAIAATQAQERIHKSCMFAQGWTDAPPVATVPSPAVRVEIYPTASAAWLADVEEFLLIYPAYNSIEAHPRLDAKVRTIAVASPHLSGPQILLAARKALQAEGVGTMEQTSDSYDLIRTQYRGSVAGTRLDQAGLGLTYAKGNGTQFPSNPTRAAFWAQESAMSGNYAGQIGFGILRFDGTGVPVNRIEGYQWIQRAAALNASAESILRDFEKKMTADELRAVHLPGDIKPKFR